MSDFALPDDTLRALLRGDRTSLASQSAQGRGYVVNIQHQYTPRAAEFTEERMATVNDQYVVEEDVVETLPDGRTIQVAAKGSAFSMADARRLGLLKDAGDVGPSEVKTGDEAANAQAAAAMAENTGGAVTEAPSETRARQEREATERAANAARDEAAPGRKR